MLLDGISVSGSQKRIQIFEAFCDLVSGEFVECPRAELRLRGAPVHREEGQAGSPGHTHSVPLS